MGSIAHARSGRNATQRAGGLTLVGLAAVLIALSGVGLNATNAGYIWADRLLNHPILFGIAAGVLAALGAAQLFGGFFRVLLILFCVAGTAIWVVWFSFAAVFSPTPWKELDVPNQADTLKARVFLTGVEEMYLIRIEQTDRGPLSRSFVAGCINGDSVGLDELRWEGSSLIADTSGGSISVTVTDDGHAGEWRQVADTTIGEQGEEQISLDAC